jgi:hypothetical protein
MDNVQNCDSYINIPSSQTYRNNQFFLSNYRDLQTVPTFKYTFPCCYPVCHVLALHADSSGFCNDQITIHTKTLYNVNAIRVICLVYV